jgi:bifunctional non-homologous end joining protein LigD
VPRFVIHEHFARSHHFDLRLERDGVLVSWAVPKGMPDDPKKNRLAIRVEDHALSHLNYTDDTPTGEGATKVSIRDSCSCEPREWRDDGVIATFDGERVVGRYAAFHTGGKNWSFHQTERP